ncbi:MAG: universal stress protein [Chloroflexia bacterium]
MAERKRILAPLDLTALSEEKLPLIEEYARALDAEVLLLHVLPGRSRSEARQAGGEAAGVSPEEANARTYLDTVAAHLHAAGVAARALVYGGPVAETILGLAREQGVSLIILGSNVRRGLSRLILGGSAEAVVRDAPCPVLLVRPALDVIPAAPAIRSFAEDSARAGVLAPHPLGNRYVDVARIIGSVGKAGALGANFRPPHPHAQEEQRYARVLRLVREGTQSSAPVDLYKLGYGYYVVDGHRRVAAYKELGYDDIYATVTEFLPASDSDAQQLFTARRNFERATGLTRVGAAKPESFARLVELINEFAAARGIEDRREAAERWRVSSYSALVGRIRALHLNRRFPGERSADIVVRLADYRRDASALHDREVDWDEALAAFAGES